MAGVVLGDRIAQRKGDMRSRGAEDEAEVLVGHAFEGDMTSGGAGSSQFIMLCRLANLGPGVDEAATRAAELCRRALQNILTF